MTLVRLLALLVAAVLVAARPAAAQQRPLLTEDPEVVGEGRVLIEAGVVHARGQRYPASGLEGNLWQLPALGVSIGISPIAEIQIDGGFYDRLSITKRSAAPLAGLMAVSDDRTHDVADVMIGAKVRLVPESGRRPALAFRFATRLPNASSESGLGLDTIDFHGTLLAAGTLQSVRMAGNVGFGILSDPIEGHAQNDVLTYGASVARAVTGRAEVVADINGRVSTREGEPFPGTESRGRLTFGSRYTRGPLRVDAGVFIGLTASDPTIGMTGGLTYVFHAFDLR